MTRDCHVVGRKDVAYPGLLSQIYDPPARLFVRGSDLDVLCRPMVAVVGSRSCSGYGRSVARSLAGALVTAGVVVVSGLARGIDSVAHQGALEAGGSTIAVLGCGIDVVYPVRNRKLAEDIRDTGLLVSEYPDQTPAAPWRFPARNRIIAGLSLATIVVEASERSGALITADFALESGREVLAVPGEITSSRSVGTNALIRHGATPVGSIPELLAELGLEAETRCTGGHSTTRERSAADRRLLDAVAAAPATLDELGRILERDAAALSAHVTELELAGLLEEADGRYRVTLG